LIMRAKAILANQNALAHNEVLRELWKEKSKRTEINLFVAH
jgi:hypothetical protein